MDLSEFVAETLVEIEKGVRSARSQSTGPWIALGNVGMQPVWGAEKVTFEVAVTTSAEGGGGIKVFSFGEVKGGVSREAVNRITFNVPVFFNSIPTEETN
ncbi:trypco2 family protein [uncultured Roseovarius sp.]|uniref:trypco2 family protein n=1 Tax=uncultured Roseovarius sp. TaxID=293344 RepID=UPI0026016B41|nr:trypco2 family protein [uncultured Roseovarius sp.]